MRKHIVATAHASSITLDKIASLDKACSIVAEAGREDVELVCFPETFIPGFPYWINLYPPAAQHDIYLRYLDHSIDLSAGDLRDLCASAVQARCNVVVGVSERVGATMYNSQIFINAQGSIVGRHRKLQPTFAEKMVWSQGDGSTMKVEAMSVGRVGGLICYEHMLNLARQALIDQDMEIHCASWPTFATSSQARNAAYDARVEVLMRAHAITGQCFVIVAQNPVSEQNLEAMTQALGPQSALQPGGGWSAIIAPDGSFLAGPHTGPVERLVIAELDLDAILRAKVLADTAGHSARPEVLSLTMDTRAFRR